MPDSVQSTAFTERAASDTAALDRRFWLLNAGVSVAALSLLTYLLLIRRVGSEGDLDLRFMPAVNASFNGLSAVLLVLGLIAIKRRAPVWHRIFMSAAFASSSLFLAGYLAYHSAHGSTIYHGPFRGAYLAMLATHIVLSVPVVPLALASFYFAFQRRFVVHKKLTRYLLPIWLYVSITGVLVFVWLRFNIG
jgi:putative membrane protein